MILLKKQLYMIKIKIPTIATLLLLIVFSSFTNEDNEDIPQDFRYSNFKETLDKLNTIGVLPDCERFNIVNENREKHGIWLVENPSAIMLTNYINGMKDGIEMTFDQSKQPIRLQYLVEYTNDSICSIISFDVKTGLPTGISVYIRENKNPIIYPEKDNPDYTLPFLFYSKYYNGNSGRIESEGYELMGNEWEIDNWLVGNWKFYDKDGGFQIKDYGLYEEY